MDWAQSPSKVKKPGRQAPGQITACKFSPPTASYAPRIQIARTSGNNTGRAKSTMIDVEHIHLYPIRVRCRLAAHDCQNPVTPGLIDSNFPTEAQCRSLLAMFGPHKVRWPTKTPGKLRKLIQTELSQKAPYSSDAWDRRSLCFFQGNKRKHRIPSNFGLRQCMVLNFSNSKCAS